MIKTKIFTIGMYQDDVRDFEEWQKNNPNIKILDTKIVSRTYVENQLLVSYEKLEEES